MKISKHKKVRYAVVGLGYISQVAVLPAFANASKNSELGALVSDDPVKLKKLAKKYEVAQTYSYDQYEECLSSGQIDAVYIALPNNMHCDYTVRAANAGIHVMCEKPMAVTEDECNRMLAATREHSVKLMIAYRLHFEEANLKALKLAHSGKLGDLRIFNSLFTMQVREGNIRLKKNLGGGTLFDIGIYCINAVRHLFEDEPLRAVAFSANNGEQRFSEVDEMTSCILLFSQNRLASFSSSFGATDIANYEIVGTKGSLQVQMAYEFSSPIIHQLTVSGRKRKSTFAKRDQFGPELLYFSKCILEDLEPEPSGYEGLADVRIINALYRSAQSGSPVNLTESQLHQGPSLQQEIRCPSVSRPKLIHAEAPTP